MEHVVILFIVVIVIAIFIIHNSTPGEYSELSTGEASTKYNLVKLISQDDINTRGIRSIDYDKLKLVIFDKYYQIRPRDLNKTLDLLDANEKVIKIGESFRINKNYSLSSPNEDINTVISSLSQESIDRLCNIILYVSDSPYDDIDDSFRNIEHARYEATLTFGKIPSLKWERVNETLEMSEIILYISGLSQTERIYNNPRFVNKTAKVSLLRVKETN